MSAVLKLITALLMLPVPTILVASPVPVTMDTLGMERCAWVSGASDAINPIKPMHSSDIDECTDDTDNCATNAACMNTPGSFTCTCSQGFTGNGVMCRGKRCK